jgi:death-on-curing protein
VKEPLWLTKAFVYALHERLIAEFGGLSGVRDEGLLESALARPENLFAYTHPGFQKLAAAYAFGIVRNHPFLDGNKRTGFVAATVFLETNGIVVKATEIEATSATLALASGKLSEDQFSAWLTKQTA